MTVALASKSQETEAPRPDIDPHPLSPYVAWAGNRNKDPILAALKTLLPEKGDVLELATGAGLHINYFAPHFPGLQFQPSDYDADVFESIKSKRALAGNGNVLDPIRIDLTDPTTFPDPASKRYDAIFVVNIFQVAPVAINDGIARLGQKVLKDDGLIAIYGPFKRDGGYTTESNAAFDKEILAANVPEWGLKDIRDLEAAAAPHGIKLREILELPANNFVLLFKKA
jgi:cyclopropane fatty-acyl-phospholipid synthase-like methyltransferase